MGGEKRFFLLCIFCIGLQHTLVGQNTAKSNTYAVVVGITKYKDSTLSTLQFADKDAALFAAYLQSKTGGNVPGDNIKLLTNEKATIAAVYNALNWLQETCKANDKAYFYFSGHGDVETGNKGLGYLLAHNSPSSNYRNNAITIEDLNKVANQLSTKSKATVVLVTDACHSGQLAGDYYQGRQLVANQLRLILNNEIRLAACGVDEKAGEGEEWGGGRGVFSYYLLKGLGGLADVNRNDTIQLRELTSYLDSVFAADKDLMRNALRQHPVLAGNPDHTMAVVEDSQSMTNISSSATPSVSLISRSSAKLRTDYLFGLMKTKAFETNLPISSYSKISKEKLPLQIVNDCIAYQQKLNREKEQSGVLKPEGHDNYFFADIDTLALLKNQLIASKELVKGFSERLIQMIHGEAQGMVNAYLDGDLAELEKREYYYAGNREYGDFVQLLRVALHIAPKEHYLYPLLEVQEAYISGLAERLKSVTAPNMPALIASAFKYQKKAMKLEPYAAFIRNEMGNLYMLSNKYAQAESEFEMAKELSPTWAIPWSNTIRLGLATGNFNKATEAIRMADSLRFGQPYILNNAGLVMAKQGKLLTAESYFQKAIIKERSHFFPYEKLGQLYLLAGDYKKADSLLGAAYVRRNGLNMNAPPFEFGMAKIEIATIPKSRKDECYFLDHVKSRAFQPYIQLARAFELMQSSPDSALQIMKVITKSVGDFPMIKHYMGKAFFAQQNWQQAMPLLLQAIRTYQSDSALTASMQRHLKIRNDTARCIIAKLMHHEYNRLEDHYLLANIYERTGALDKAIEQYSIIIDIENDFQKDQAAYKASYLPPGMNSERLAEIIFESNTRLLLDRFQTPAPMGGYLKMADIYERSGDYVRAERAYLQQIRLSHEVGNLRKVQAGSGRNHVSLVENTCSYCLAVNKLTESSTFNFYQRMLKLFPRDTEWQEKMGMFLYERLLIAFEKVPPSKYRVAYESLKYYMYPLVADEDAIWQPDFRFELPGTGETISILTPKYDPLKEALESLKLSVKLSGEIQPKSAVLEAIADLNSWMGNEKAAFETYKELARKEEPNARLSSKIISYCFLINESDFALNQLENLHRSGKTSQAQNLQLAECYALNGSTDEALAILNKTPVTSNVQKADLGIRYAKTNWLAGRYAKALEYLTDLPGNDSALMSPDSAVRATASRYYSTARLHALLKEDGKALTSLSRALQSGFAFGHVLETDEAWNPLRQSAGWMALKQQYLSQFRLQNYSETDPENLSTIRRYLIGIKVWDSR